MVDERPADTESAVDPTARPRRAPPTIDLEATQVSTEVPEEANRQPSGENVNDEAAASAAPPEPEPEPEPEPAAETAEAPPASEPQAAESGPKPISPWVIAPVSGAVAAALVIGVGWLLGWPAVQPVQPPALQTPQVSASAVDDLSRRVAGLESKADKPASPVLDPAVTARLDGLEQSVSALRSDLAASREASEKAAAAVDQMKAAPGDGTAPAPAPDLSPIEDRIAKIESAVQAQADEIVRQGRKLAESSAAEPKPADDAPLRRVVAASLLDVAVRHGDAYRAPLDAAKSLSDNSEALKPLEAFAASGLPDVPALCRELLEIVPKLAPPAPATATTGSGIIDRLQSGAAKLVRIERTDAAGTDRGSIVARITAAALRNDLAEALRELKMLPPADRAAAQGWLDRVEAREAALAASRAFADDAMAGLAKTGQ